MTEIDQQKKTQNQNRKHLLETFLASTNIQQTKNSIRSIIDAHTHNITFQTTSANVLTPAKLTRQVVHTPDTHFMPFLDAIKSLKQPLEKITDQNNVITENLDKIKTESINLLKPSHQQVKISAKQFTSWKLWIGKVFQQIFQRSFHLYSNQTLLYDEMRTFCCQKIILNLIYFSQFHGDALKATPCVQWQNEVNKIIQHECNKYPQTSQSQVNKKLYQIVDRNKINNFQSDDNDLIDKTNVQFKYKPSNDYTEEIMRFLNQVITLPEKVIGKKKGMNLFTNFHIFFTNVFNLVEHRNCNNDMQLLMDQSLRDDEYCRYKFMSQDEIEYKQKVKSYTKIQLGSKIPLNAPIYASDQIVSGNIELKSKPVGRVIDKWIDELRQKIIHPEKFIRDRIHRFKGEQPSERTKLTKKQKEILIQNIHKENTNFSNFSSKLHDNIEYLTEKLMSDLGNLTEITYMQESERAAGEFACKLQQANVQYSIQTLNFLIGSLLKAVQNMKKDISKTNPYSFIGEDIKLNLITFKIGDLLRCKFTSKQDEVIRVFEFLITMSEMNYLNIFKIIRIKNRLHSSTRDILVNALFKNEVVCEIQLAINQTTNQKQKFMDKFNHFLYQLKRAEVGVMLQICNIWVKNSPKSQTFKKAIIKERERKRKNRSSVCKNAVFQLFQNKHQVQRLPFICKICKIFYPKQRTIFQSLVFGQYPDPICGQCLSTRIQKVQRLKYLFGGDQKPVHIMNYMSKFKIYQMLREIFDLEQLKNHQYLVMIPIQSRKINKFGVRKITTNQITFLVSNQLTDDGKLEVQVKHQIINSKSMNDQQKKLFSKYCIFTYDNFVEMKQVVLSKQNFNALMQHDFKKIQIFQAKNQNRLQCLYMPLGQESVLFPIYYDPTVNLVQKLKNQMNIMKIIRSIKDSKEVLELSGIQMTQQMNDVPAGIKIKMNTIIKQMYLDDNLMEDISFVSQIPGLAILTARNNRIKRIPQLPDMIEIIDLSHNHLQKIEGFSNKIYEQLRIINLGANKIAKIEGVNNVPNLKQLSLYKNSIRVIQGLDNLQKLVRLKICYNPIRKIENISNLKSIQYLSIGNTQVNQINGLKCLQSLTTLILDVSSFSLHDTIQLPSRIKNLNLSNNNITSMTPLKQLKHVQQLILHNNTIPTIQPSQWLHNLKLLNLSCNKINQIPQMRMLTDLKQLYLSHNSITEVKGLEENLFLTVLDVSHNRIRQLKNIKYLVNLTKLSAKNNQIQQMEQFDNLKSLNQIQLADNLISKIIAIPQSLKKINLQNNRIKSLDWISELIKKKSQEDKLQEINLKNNQIPQVMLILVKNLLGINSANIIV